MNGCKDEPWQGSIYADIDFQLYLNVGASFGQKEKVRIDFVHLARIRHETETEYLRVAES